MTNNKTGPTPQGSDEDLQVVEYERPSAAGEDPFTTAADVDGEEVVRFKRTSGSSAVDTHEPFGGSGSLHVCDREALVKFLLSHKQQRRVWAGVLGVDDDKDSVSRYVRSLTPVTLTVDTRITNHMYVNGRAVPFQSILVAGTAVLSTSTGDRWCAANAGTRSRPIHYPKIHCKGCPPHYNPPKQCKWRIYDPWYGYPPEWLPPEWRDPYPKSYPKPKPWAPTKKGKYCYILYPDPPEVDYPPRWYPPQAQYQPKPRYQPTYKPSDDSDSDDSDDHGEDPCPEEGCVNQYTPEEPSSDNMQHHSDN